MTIANLTILTNLAASVDQIDFASYWRMSPDKRKECLELMIIESHAWHYQRNIAYRNTLTARGVSEIISPSDFNLLLRPTSQTFKSYIDLLETPFPQDKPHDFLHWLADQLSIEIPRDRFDRFKDRYVSLEAMLKDFETQYYDFGLEVSTSSGTSGRSTIMLRNQNSIALTVESFYLCFQRYFGMRADHRAIFIMPQHTRIAMARMAEFSILRVGLGEERVHYAIPFPAEPDQVRIRGGMTFQSGWRGWIERQILHPFMNWMNDHIVMPRAVDETIRLLEKCQANQEKVLVFGSWIQLHQVALKLKQRGQIMQLTPGSLFGSGGGFKERYPYTISQIQEVIRQSVQLSDGSGVPMGDVYGMAEGNWAAMQCSYGNYHIPPWVYAVTLDENDEFQVAADTTGILAFFDPIGGGDLFPAFFKTADQVRLINGVLCFDPDLNCPCGEDGAHIRRESIQRVDLIGEAGCAAQI